MRIFCRFTSLCVQNNFKAHSKGKVWIHPVCTDGLRLLRCSEQMKVAVSLRPAVEPSSPLPFTCKVRGKPFPWH